MPVISRFLGIVVAMYFNDHEPPHFHVRYEGKEAKISIADLGLIECDLPRRVISLVIEWAFQHRPELLANWELCRERKHPKKIEPLE